MTVDIYVNMLRSDALYYFVLYCIVLCCTVLLRSDALYYFVLCCVMLCSDALYYFVLYCAAMCFAVRYCIVHLVL